MVEPPGTHRKKTTADSHLLPTPTSGLQLTEPQSYATLAPPVVQPARKAPVNLNVVIISFIAFLGMFTAIGVASSRKKQDTADDYLVASRSVNPWLTALSAVATANSGYMFIGLIGEAWRTGLQVVWVAFGWIVGDLVTWFWVHKRVRERSERVDAASVPALLALDNDKTNHRLISIAAALLTFFLLGAYAAAQLKAGATTLHSIFGWPVEAGAVLGIIVVVAYCFSGGIRASIWTDAAQSAVMIIAMAILLFTCFTEVGGVSAVLGRLEAIDPKLVQVIPDNLLLGIGLYALGWVFAGMGTVGQPHILIRFMAIESTKAVNKARVIYFVWFTLFTMGAVGVGLYARILLPDLTTGVADVVMASETALPALAQKMLPSALIGVMLAGIFSATMSTADSQLLSCSAAITQDLAPRFRHSYMASKMATLAVAGVALAIALFAPQGVFSLVLVAWAGLGACLGPVLVVRLTGKPLHEFVALAMMGSALLVVVFWGDTPWGGSVYKILPAMLVAFGVYFVGTLLTKATTSPS